MKKFKVNKNTRNKLFCHIFEVALAMVLLYTDRWLGLRLWVRDERETGQ